MLNYTNSKIKELHKSKSFLIPTLNKLYKQHGANPCTNIHINNTKHFISKINKSLKAEYKTAYNKYWDCQLKAINHHNLESFLPKINRFFRAKSQLKIDCFQVKQNDIPLLNGAQCKPNDLPMRDNKYIIETPNDILNVIGAYYETINSPRYSNINTAIKAQVDSEVAKLIQLFKNNTENNRTITEFNDNNPATNPTQPDNTLIFTNTFATHLNFRNLPNKTSAGLDNIPPIIRYIQ